MESQFMKIIDKYSAIKMSYGRLVARGTCTASATWCWRQQGCLRHTSVPHSRHTDASLGTAPHCRHTRSWQYVNRRSQSRGSASSAGPAHSTAVARSSRRTCRTHRRLAAPAHAAYINGSYRPLKPVQTYRTPLGPTFQSLDFDDRIFFGDTRFQFQFKSINTNHIYCF